MDDASGRLNVNRSPHVKCTVIQFGAQHNTKMAEIAKRLSFNDTGGLNTTSETHGNVEELRR